MSAQNTKSNGQYNNPRYALNPNATTTTTTNNTNNTNNNTNTNADTWYTLSRTKGFRAGPNTYGLNPNPKGGRRRKTRRRGTHKRRARANKTNKRKSRWNK